MSHASFGDGAHIIYVNSQIKDETELGRLMHDFSCTDADDMKYKILADRVRYFKEDKKGVETMCKVMEDMRNEVVKTERFNFARILWDMGIRDVNEIAAKVQLPVTDVKEAITGTQPA